ncbi:MAG: formylglycine-generating enzyme family protein [Polyangiaceae bacterium]|nr:formylglycine-generating enzyme family protein [Polyangiaceae bacterium]
MAHLNGYCIDRWEVHTIDKKTKKSLSPYYPPSPYLLKFVHNYWSVESWRIGTPAARKVELPDVPHHQQKSFQAEAISRPGVIPQGYMTYHSAKRACINAGKRLCSEEEWEQACKGQNQTKHPYGANYRQGYCNVFRHLHPAFALHGNSSLGHLDPRLNLVFDENQRALLELTGAMKKCISTHGDENIYDMVGNLDEWVEDPQGTFRGGFYARGTREGCEASISSHGPMYADYSLGTRCCMDAE